jgi:hypothetical protein
MSRPPTSSEQPRTHRRSGDDAEQRETGNGAVARDHERAMLLVMPAFREREYLEGAVDVGCDAERPHQEHARALRILGRERPRIESEVAGHA